MADKTLEERRLKAIAAVHCGTCFIGERRAHRIIAADPLTTEHAALVELLRDVRNTLYAHNIILESWHLLSDNARQEEIFTANALLDRIDKSGVV